MKKMQPVLLAALLVISTLAACTNNANTPQDNSGDSSASSEAGTQTGGSELQADIVVIGAGGAGMTAAIQANQDGAGNIVILEKMAQVGGNTVRSTGGLNAANTKYQQEKGVEDSVELMVEDTIKGGKELNDKELVTVMAEKSAEAVDFVNDIGGDLTEVGRAGGASVDRIHRPQGGSAVGPMLVKALSDKVSALEIPVMLNTEATEILVDENGAVTGVKAKGADGEMTINCKAVVLATGGFGANPEMVEKYVPTLKGFKTTNHAGALGEGIVMAENIGAAFVDMDQIQTHPTVEPESATMYTEGVRGDGAILVNKEGKRFVNELLTRDVVSEAILKQTDGISYLIFDQSVRESLAATESYIKAGIITEADTIEELAEKLGIDAAEFAKTMEAYTGYQASGTDADFERDDMKQPLTSPKFYAGVCAPAIHHTMGGVKINTNCEVLKEDGTAIAGLFATGEITGGVHGGNRLGGTAVTDIVVFGRIAGSSAFQYVEANGGQTESTISAQGGEEAAIPEVDGNYKDGTYTGTAKGNNGDVTVEVTVTDGNIVSVKMTEHTETEGIYEGAEKEVGNAIIRTQSTEVDVVAGATNTSNAIIEAVNSALEGASLEAAA